MYAYKEESGCFSKNSNENEISREDIEAAIAKTVELRAIHAALRFPSAAGNGSGTPLSSSHLSAQDYPVFTPSYDDDPLPGYQQISMDSRNYAESWGEHTAFDGGGTVDESVFSGYRTANESSRKGIINFEGHICPADEQFSTVGSCTSHTNLFRSSAAAAATTAPPEYSKSRRNSMGDIASMSSCNKCRPAVISSEGEEGLTRKGGKSNLIVPLTDSHSSLHSQPRGKGIGMWWPFPRLKKKSKNESDQVSQMFKELGVVSAEMLKKEVVEANESRDAALSQAAEMKSSLGELKKKSEYLESYCEELKKALRQGVPENISQPKRGMSVNGKVGNVMPVSEETMVEGFLQIVSEARLSVKQFCKILIEEADNLNSLLQPYKLSLASKHSKLVLYHLEAIINQAIYQDFENCAFRKNGTPKHLDPQQHRQAQFQSFVALRNLNWNEVVRKGTKYYSEELSKFCDEKMSGIIAAVGCTRPWSEQLLQAFFVAAKCIWLLHSLALSFDRPLGIMRVEENMAFDGSYMEDVFGDRQRSQGRSRVKIMVMPGFYVLDSVLRCKVLCRYKPVS